MEIRELGSSGIRASSVGLGTWAIGGWMWGGTHEEDSIAAIRASIDAGVTLIDTAPAYGFGYAEQMVGRAVQGRREEVVLSTKCGLRWDDTRGEHFFDDDGRSVYRLLGPDSIRTEVERSLVRLDTDWIDVYHTHWQDSTTAVEDSMAALIDLKREGKIRAIGACNTTAQELDSYLAAGDFDVLQERYSAIDRDIERTHLERCLESGTAILSYSSLALGLLSGTQDPSRVYQGDDQRREDPRFTPQSRQSAIEMLEPAREIALDRGASVAQVVIAWTLARAGITVALCGARNAGQAEENARAGDLILAPTELNRLSQLFDQHGWRIGETDDARLDDE